MSLPAAQRERQNIILAVLQLWVNRNYPWLPTTNETSVLQYLLLILFFTPQISKGVDDDTKYEVKNDDDDEWRRTNKS